MFVYVESVSFVFGLLSCENSQWLCAPSSVVEEVKLTQLLGYHVPVAETQTQQFSLLEALINMTSTSILPN